MVFLLGGFYLLLFFLFVFHGQKRFLQLLFCSRAQHREALLVRGAAGEVPLRLLQGLQLSAPLSYCSIG